MRAASAALTLDDAFRDDEANVRDAEAGAGVGVDRAAAERDARGVSTTGFAGEAAGGGSAATGGAGV